MGRLKRESLNGLPGLGSRLREIREAAGLSQMKVAELMGFNPTHGYKYILKLEKGTVPNPTLRTIISFLEVCGADWPDLVAALPHAGYRSGARPGPAPDTPTPTGPETPGHAVLCDPDSPRPRSRDRRPLRVRLKEERIAERERRTQELWHAASRTETAVTKLLRSSAVRPGRHRDYLAFIRPCCFALQFHRSARPRVIENEVNRLLEPAVESGLDRTILQEIVRLCRENIAAPDIAPTEAKPAR